MGFRLGILIVEGLTGVVGELLFLWVFDAIEDWRTQFGKTSDFCQKFSLPLNWRISKGIDFKNKDPLDITEYFSY